MERGGGDVSWDLKMQKSLAEEKRVELLLSQCLSCVLIGFRADRAVHEMSPPQIWKLLLVLLRLCERGSGGVMQGGLDAC